MRTIVIHVCGVLVLMTAMAGGMQDTGGPARARELASHLRTTMDSMPTAFAIDAETRFLMKTADGKETHQMVDIKYYRDDGCVDIAQSTHTYQLVNGRQERSPGAPLFTRAMIDRNKHALIYDSRKADKVPQSVAYWDNGPANFDRVSKRLSIGRVLEGFVAHDDISLALLLDDPTCLLNHKGQTAIDGHQCDVLEATIAGRGRYTLFLDPNCGYLPRKVSVTKKGSDVFGGTKVADMSGVPGPVEEVSYTMDITAFENIDGRVMPMACRTSLIWTYTSGKTSEWHGQHERSAITLDPDFKANRAFEPDIPDGTRVLYQDYVGTGVQFEWAHGRVQTYVSANYLNSLDNAAREIQASHAVGETQDNSGTSSGTAQVEEPAASKIDSVAVNTPSHPSRLLVPVVAGTIIMGVLIAARRLRRCRS